MKLRTLKTATIILLILTASIANPHPVAEDGSQELLVRHKRPWPLLLAWIPAAFATGGAVAVPAAAAASGTVIAATTSFGAGAAVMAAGGAAALGGCVV